jgi:hypothetical protein
MRRRFRSLAGVLALLAFTGATRATVIEYDVTNVSANSWRYDYSVTNDTLGFALDEFTVFFDRTLYGDLVFGGAPIGWDPLLIQPDPALPDDGFYDALALGPGIAAGSTQSGFFVTFAWLAAGTPGAQPFDIVDAVTIETLDSGITRLRSQNPEPPVPVPEPDGPAPLMLAGMLMLLALHARRLNRKRRSLDI